MKAVAAFFGVTLVVLAIGIPVFGLIFPGAAEHRAIYTSGAIALVVQLFTFAIVRLMSRTNVIAGWGLGALLRMATLAVYALAIVKPYGLPGGAALLSLATFFFISTLIEPVLLTL